MPCQTPLTGWPPPTHTAPRGRGVLRDDTYIHDSIRPSRLRRARPKNKRREPAFPSPASPVCPSPPGFPLLWVLDPARQIYTRYFLLQNRRTVCVHKCSRADRAMRLLKLHLSAGSLLGTKQNDSYPSIVCARDLSPWGANHWGWSRTRQRGTPARCCRASLARSDLRCACYLCCLDVAPAKTHVFCPRMKQKNLL